jgi:hypothetical protein
MQSVEALHMKCACETPNDIIALNCAGRVALQVAARMHLADRVRADIYPFELWFHGSVILQHELGHVQKWMQAHSAIKRVGVVLCTNVHAVPILLHVRRRRVEVMNWCFFDNSDVPSALGRLFSGWSVLVVPEDAQIQDTLGQRCKAFALYSLVCRLNRGSGSLSLTSVTAKTIDTFAAGLLAAASIQYKQVGSILYGVGTLRQEWVRSQELGIEQAWVVWPLNVASTRIAAADGVGLKTVRIEEMVDMYAAARTNPLEPNIWPLPWYTQVWLVVCARRREIFTTFLVAYATTFTIMARV